MAYLKRDDEPEGGVEERVGGEHRDEEEDGGVAPGGGSSPQAGADRSDVPTSSSGAVGNAGTTEGDVEQDEGLQLSEGGGARADQNTCSTGTPAAAAAVAAPDALAQDRTAYAHGQAGAGGATAAAAGASRITFLYRLQEGAADASFGAWGMGQARRWQQRVHARPWGALRSGRASLHCAISLGCLCSRAPANMLVL